MYKIIKTILLFLLLIFSSKFCKTYAQGISPYSRYGYGDEIQDGFARNVALAGTGVSMPNSIMINNINPALLSYNNTMTTFEFGANWQKRRLDYSSGNSNAGGTNISYLSLCLPLTKKWVVAIGGKPFSNTNSSYQQIKTVSSNYETVSYNNKNSTVGGLNKFYLSNGVSINKNLKVGATVGLILGSFNQTNEISGLVFNNTSQKSKEIYRMVDITLGAAYRKKLNDQYQMHFGGTFNAGKSVFSDKIDYNLYSTREFGNTIFLDTVNKSSSPKISLPTKIKIGASIEKFNKWNASLDISTGIWDQVIWSDQKFKNTFSAAGSFEIIPNINALRGYQNRISYRTGAYFTTLPIIVNGNTINEKAVSFGVGLPMKKSLASVNLSMVVGQRGTINYGLVKETFVKVMIGTSFSDRWFVRPKID